MGRNLDALFCRRVPRTRKLRVLLSLTLSRLTILKNHHSSRCSHASYSILMLLQNGYREHAILKAENVVKEKNMLDVFSIVEGYCNMLLEMSTLMEHNSRDCPNEIREAIESLIFVASRSSELLELQDVRRIFESWYGSELAEAAVEVSSGCTVNPKIVENMSRVQANHESRVKVVKDIASSNGLLLDLDGTLPGSSRTNSMEGPSSPRQELQHPEDSGKSTEELQQKEGKYLEKEGFADATGAAQMAFELATKAAAAARTAVELSGRGTRGRGFDEREQTGEEIKEENGEGNSCPSSRTPDHQGFFTFRDLLASR